MAIPIIYNLRSVRARWISAIVAVLGIAGTVGVFIAMLSLARGFKATLVASGSPDNALIRRAGCDRRDRRVGSTRSGEGDSRRTGSRAGWRSATGESGGGVVAAFPLKATGTDANVQVRGVSPDALKVRRNVKIERGTVLPAGIERTDRGTQCAVDVCGA